MFETPTRSAKRGFAQKPQTNNFPDPFGSLKCSDIRGFKDGSCYLHVVK